MSSISPMSAAWERQDGDEGNRYAIYYLEGLKDGKTEAQKLIRAQFQSNLKKAQELGIQMFQEIKESLEVTPVRLSLKAETFTSFYFVFAFEQDVYLSDKLIEAYRIIRKYKKGSQTETFKFSFLCMPKTESFEESCLVADGYLLFYEEKPS